MEIALREWPKDDWRSYEFEALWRLDQECFPSGVSYTRAELASYIGADRSFTYVAEKLSRDSVKDLPSNSLSKGLQPTSLESRILGFIIAEASRRGIGHIITIDVSPKARRLGTGSKLLTSAEQRLRTEKCHNVRLETAVDNLSALTFYKRHGYHVMKTVPRYYSNGIDALVLEKSLG
ncbi:MAG TPA: N-acetyltransferase [Terriglobales bacterium]|nr:N-acetyltransferase [Terriglobales bacterium]